MGVSGSGKTCVGRALAAALGWQFIEGDDLHSAANKAKMASGRPLDDADRWPWLDAIAGAAHATQANGSSAIVACSALKRAYRDRLRHADPAMLFVHLNGTRDVIAARLAARTDHFMPPALLDSQLATLEPPAPDEQAIILDVERPVAEIVGTALAAIDPD